MRSICSRRAAASPIHTFQFGRQRRQDGLCLSDYILDPADGRRDHLALFVVTAGAGIREKSEEWKQAGEYFKAHGLQALAIETAEGCAEWLHRRIREDWGFPDPPTMTMQDRFTSRYRGKRYSFGYPACPNLDDQAGLWKLLRPEEIGVELTEGMMMEPEASVSALVFHHPDCAYFTAGEEDAEIGAAKPGRPLESGEAAHRVGFVFVNVEYRVQLGDLQQILHTVSQAQELQMTALVGDGRIGGNQLADTRAVDVGYFLQVEKDVLVILLHQFPQGIAQGARPFTQGDPAGHVDYGYVTHLPSRQLNAH